MTDALTGADALRLVQVASEHEIRIGFASREWDESSSGQYLAQKFIEEPEGIAGQQIPAVVVLMAVQSAVDGYFKSREFSRPVLSVIQSRLQDRAGDIAKILGADDESVRVIEETLSAGLVLPHALPPLDDGGGTLGIV